MDAYERSLRRQNFFMALIILLAVICGIAAVARGDDGATLEYHDEWMIAPGITDNTVRMDDIIKALEDALEIIRDREETIIWGDMQNGSIQALEYQLEQAKKETELHNRWTDSV